MSNMDKRREIIDTGIELLEEKLVARTWGNISARIDADNYLITPSGLDYTSMREEDIVSVNIKIGEYTGINRPSGEKGVHSAAYEVFDDVNFVVHTHQTYATAVSLAGFDSLEATAGSTAGSELFETSAGSPAGSESFDITEEEIEKLGGIALAEYGLPGTKEITNACKSALLTGAHTVLMIHHGVLVLGKDKEEAMKRVKLLESICERNVKRVIIDNTPHNHLEALDNYLKALNTCPEDNSSYRYCEVLTDKALIALSNSETEIFSQLDDVSQMIGTKIVTVDSLDKALKLSDNAVLIKGVGALIKAENKDDLEALKVLMNKMAIVKLYTKAKNVKAEISIEESDFMHYDYVTRYSKQNIKNRKI
ncbi:MAG: class II aldolase/adducin family protein [Lachnospiraceae bacterium]|nr:class II aldolase/adducin family protein [Lachnospiraceae bacterium]